jgi:hypothetical protein
MAESEPTPAPAEAESQTTEQAFAGVMDALVELMRAGARPDVLEAQRLLLQRLANQGAVFPSRIPLPRNITEVGGYLNLLERAGQLDMRLSAVASALGIASPAAALDPLSGALPVGFVQAPNDRPPGPVQASIPPLIAIRADFHAPFLAALQLLHASGCMLPLRAPRPVLPASQPGATPASLDLTVILAALGRTLEVFPDTVLVDPAADALAIARLETPATDPLRLVARELDGGTLVAEASWVAKRASATGVTDDPPTLRRYLEVAPIMQAAGWIHPQPLVAPASRSERGSLARFVNLTGLVAGETTLGDELELLYAPAAIGRSALASVLQWRWDGTTFVNSGET